jgi:hypothetical protein
MHGPRERDHCDGCPAVKIYRRVFRTRIAEAWYCMLEPEPRFPLRRAPNVEWRCRCYRCKLGEWKQRLQSGEKAKIYT